MITRKRFFPFLLFIASGCEHETTSNVQLHATESAYSNDTIRQNTAANDSQSIMLSNKLGFADTLVYKTKPGFEADDVILKNDTLCIIASSISVLYPFGQVQHTSDIQKKYPFFTFTKGQSKANGQVYPYTLLRYKKSSVKFYDNEEDGATIIAGHIADKEVVLRNNVHINQSFNDVLSAFFTRIPNEKLGKTRVIRVDYVIDRIKYYYEFNNGALNFIDIDSYSVIDKAL